MTSKLCMSKFFQACVIKLSQLQDVKTCTESCSTVAIRRSELHVEAQLNAIESKSHTKTDIAAFRQWDFSECVSLAYEHLGSKWQKDRQASTAGWRSLDA